MKRWLPTVERVFLVTGLMLLFAVALALGHRWFFSRLAISEFEQTKNPPAQEEAPKIASLPGEETVDFSLWSDKRIQAYRESLRILTSEPMGVVNFPRLGVRAPIFEGTDDLVLNRGVGWISGTGRPGEEGDVNVGLAGHRDGFFRGFKDIQVRDAVELATKGGNHIYEVDSIEIVAPEDVRVLLPRGVPSLTFVTCYPFYFIGDAPQRFIVHAKLMRVEAQKL